MDVSRTIKCTSFWEALVLRLMLEEHGAQVHHSDEGAVLSMVASGSLDAIKAAAAQLSREFPRARPVMIEGEDRDEGAAKVQPAPPSHPMTEESYETDPPNPKLSPSSALRRPPRASNANPPPSPVMPDLPGAFPGRAEPADVAPAESANSRPASGYLNGQVTADHDPVEGEVVVVQGEVRYHRRNCILIRLLGSDDLKTLPQQQAEADGCVPCRACEPDRPLSR
jgi:hypothetical protein